jgi:hypothetical protein
MNLSFNRLRSQSEGSGELPASNHSTTMLSTSFSIV